MLINRTEIDADVPVGKHEQPVTLTLEQACKQILRLAPHWKREELIADRLREGEEITAGCYQYWKIDHPTLAELEAAPILRPTPKPETQVDGFDI